MLAIGLVLLAVVGTVGAYSYWKVIDRLIKRTDLTLEPRSGKALNILIVGSDSREGLTTADDISRFGQVGGKRSDTIILAQLIPTEQRGVLLSFPRDLYVTVHGSGREFRSKINAAFGYGPQAMIDTVGALTSLPINHYMEIDIRGFRGIVDAIGGIDITNTAPFYDSKLQLRLPAGTSHLDGNLALNFVRARHATPDGDFGRIKRQQQFLKAVMAKIGKPAVLTNPVRVNQLARAFAKNVVVDQFFQLDDLVKVALSVRRTPQLETFSVPSRSARLGGQSVVLIDDQQAQPLFTALRNAEDPAKTVPGAAQAAGP